MIRRVRFFRKFKEVDSSVPLTHHNPKDLGSICLVKKRKIHFGISLSDLKIQSWFFLKKRTLKSITEFAAIEGAYQLAEQVNCSTSKLAPEFFRDLLLLLVDKPSKRYVRYIM